MGLVNIRIQSNIDSLISAVQQLGENLENVGSFAAAQIIQSIRYQVFDTVVELLAREAGDFPQVYLEHLIAAMKRLPIETSFSNKGFLHLNIDLDPLGNKEALTLGYHDQALLGESYDGSNWQSIHVGHSSDGGHAERQQVDLPWLGGTKETGLMTPKERREEFWETVIINRDVEGFISTINGAGLQAVLRRILANPPTYEEIAAKRVTVWINAGVAPEWLLLEYGSAASGTQPVIEAVNFSEVLDSACQCVASKVINNMIKTILEVFKKEMASGTIISVNSKGRPFVRAGQGARSGRFVKFADIRDETPVDIADCLDF